MTLQELLKKYFGDDETKMNTFLDEMKANKIFISGEENIDIRYNKLKGQFDTLNSQNAESLKLIEELKKSNTNTDEMKGKIDEYEKKIAELEEEKTTLAIDNALKFALLEKGAKASDLDYLTYRIKKGEDELKLDKDGNVKGLDTIVEEIAKTCSSNFEDKSKKKVDVKDLPQGDDKKNTITKEMFAKMGYKERNKLYQENKELYEQLNSREGE